MYRKKEVPIEAGLTGHVTVEGKCWVSTLMLVSLQLWGKAQDSKEINNGLWNGLTCLVDIVPDLV